MSILSRLAPGLPDFSPQAEAAPFVGRGEELRLLDGCLQEALDGHPQMLFVHGDAGIGKTRLLRELRGLAQARGARVCYGRCYEGLTLPYLPFVVSLLNQIETLAVPSHGALGDDVRTIEAFLRGAAAPPAIGERAPVGEGDHDRLRLFLAIAHLTIALAQAGPLLFIVDDLHWADQSSLDLFGHLAFSIADAAQTERVPLLIVGSHRNVEAEHPLARILARCRREAICRTIDLSGLDDGETETLVRGLGLARPPQHVVRTIRDATAGNPLFIQEAVHQLRRTGAVDLAGRYRAQRISAADLQLPSEVTVSIRARLHELPPAVQGLLTVAAVLGDTFTLPLLAAVSGHGEDETLRLLEEARQQRLLASRGEQFQFAHPLIREVLYRAPSAPQRQHLHLRVADALERFREDDVYDADLEIAHHLIEAGPVATPDRVLASTRRAGSHALALFAWNDAARYYDAARAAAQRAGTASLHDLAELRYWSGYAHYRSMDVSSSGELFAEAMAGFRAEGNLPGLAQALVDRTRLQLAHGGVGLGTPFDLTPLDEALAGLGEADAALCGELLAEIADVCWVVRQEARAHDASRRALEIGRRIGDDALCTHALFSLAMIQWQSLRLEESLENFTEAAACARRAGDPWNEAAALARRPQVLFCQGRMADAEATAQEALDLGRAVNDWAEYSLALAAVELLALAHGDLPAAEQAARQVLRMADRSQYPWSGVQALTAIACGRANAGLWAEAEDAIAISVEPGRLFPDAGPVLRAGAAVYQQLIRAYAGEAARVRADLAANPQLTRTPHHADLFALSGLCALVEIAARIGEPELATRIYPALLGAAASGAIISGSWPFLLPRVLGLAATLGRDWHAAERHFEQALEVARREALDPALGRSGLDYARMLVARGGRGDRDRAVQLLHQAIPVLYDAQARPFAREAQTLAAALHADLPDPQSATGRAQALSERERSIVAALARGRQETEIAEEWLLRPETVAGFITGLCARTGTTRQTLPAYMRDHGWLAPSGTDSGHRPVVQDVAAQPALRAGLSARELEVLRLIAAGKTNREIAEALVISPRTVETHVVRIYEKIGAANRAEAAAYAVRQGLTAP